MRIGRFDRRITIQTPATTSTALDGQASLGWVTYASRWAQRIQGGGDEKIEQGKLIASSMATFAVRYDAETAAITERMRILLGDQTYNIRRAYDPDGERAVIHLVCEERH